MECSSPPESFEITVRKPSGAIVLGPVAVPVTLTVQMLKSMLHEQSVCTEANWDIIRGHGGSKLEAGHLVRSGNGEGHVEILVIQRQWGKGHGIWQEDMSAYEADLAYYRVEAFQGDAANLQNCYDLYRERARNRSAVHENGESRIKETLRAAEAAFDGDPESLQELLEYISGQTFYFDCVAGEVDSFADHDPYNDWTLNITEACVSSANLRLRITLHMPPAGSVRTAMGMQHIC